MENLQDQNKIKDAIREEYSQIASQDKSENEKSFTNLKKQKISHKFKNAKKRSQIWKCKKC